MSLLLLIVIIILLFGGGGYYGYRGGYYGNSGIGIFGIIGILIILYLLFGHPAFLDPEPQTLSRTRPATTGCRRHPVQGSRRPREGPTSN